MNARIRGIVAAAFTAQAVGIGATVGAFSLFVRPLSEAFSASTLEVASGISLMTLTMGCCGIPIGVWLDRGSPRHVMFTGCAILVSGLLLASHATSLGELGLLCVMMGSGVPMLGPVTTAAVVGKATAEHRGRALGVANLGVPVGGLTFALVVGLVMDAWDWRAALQASAAIVFAAAVPAIAIGIPRDLGQVEDGPALTGSEDSLWTPRRLFRSPVFGLCALILGLGMGTSAGWVAHVAPYLSDLGATTRYAGLLLGSTQGFMIIGTLWLGAMVDRRSSVSILLGVFTVQMGCFALLLSQPGLQMVSIIMLGFGVASGGFLPVFGHLLAERFGTASLGRTMGLANIGLLPFGFGLPMVAGALRDARGNYDAVLLVCMCLFLTGVGALLLLSRQLQVRRFEASPRQTPETLARRRNTNSATPNRHSG